MGNALDNFFTGLTIGDDIKSGRDKRSLAEQQGRLAEEQIREAKGQNDERDALKRNQQLMTLAERAGVAADGGRRVDIEKLTVALQGGRDGKSIDPRIQALAVALGNEDLATKRNPGFTFDRLVTDPESNLLTMQGSYPNGEVAPLTTNRSSDPNAEVGFGSTEDIAKIMEMQYFKHMSDPNDTTGRQVDQKIQLGDVEEDIAALDETIQTRLAQQYAEVDRALHATGNEALRAQLQKSYGVEQDSVKRYAILEMFVSKLNIENKLPAKEEVIAVTEAVKKEEAPRNPDGTEQRPALSNVPIDELQAKIDKVPQTGPGIIDEKLTAKTDAASDEELLQGKVTFGPEELKTLRDNLEAAGVDNLSDIDARNTSERDRRAIYAVLSSLPGVTEAQKNQYNTAMLNLDSTGNAAFDAKSLAAAKVAQQNATSSALTAATGVKNANTSAVSAETARRNSSLAYRRLNEEIRSSNYDDLKAAKINLRKVLFDQDNNNEPKDIDFEQYKNAVFGDGGSISSVWGKYKNEREGSRKNQIRRHMLEQFSAFIQAGSADGDLEWSFFATDSGATVNFGDSALSNIAISGQDANGMPTEWIRIKPGSSGIQDGDKWTAKQVQEAVGSDEMYRFFVQEMRNAAQEKTDG